MCIVTFCVSRRRRKIYYGHARLCVCLSGPHSANGRLGGVCVRCRPATGGRRGAPPKPRAAYGKLARRPTGDRPPTGGVLNINAGVWNAGFHWWRSGNKKRTQNVSEYMLVYSLYAWFIPIRQVARPSVGSCIVLIISVMLSDVNLHHLTLAVRCPVSGCWPSCFN